MPRESGLIAEMEREAEEAGLGGWYNGNPEEVPESWSGSNSGALASQDRVGTTLLTTIGGRTLPNPVRVPDNIVHPAVLTSLMEGPVCHRYDFLVRLFGTDLLFFELFKLYFHLGLITTPHALYVHMTYVNSLFLCFILHAITWPREVIIVL